MGEQTSPSPPPTASPPKLNRARSAAQKVKRFIIRLITVVVVGAAVYYAGWFHGSGGLGNARQELTELRSQLLLERGRSRLMDLRSMLFQCVMDIQHENFGTARERLQSVAEQLSDVPTANALQMEDLEKLAQGLSELSIGADLDPGEQQRRILDVASSLEAHLPAVEP